MSPPSDRRLRVLIVEDDVDGANSLRAAIELMGHEVHVGRDGLEGIELARQHRPEVVLCDIGLPGKNGFEVARELRTLVPDALLVALSGYSRPEDLKRAEEAGFAHHVGKPTEIEALEQLLSKAAHGKWIPNAV